ncbi:MAG TPA: hypothetical protein EYH01_03730 [Campylobacterales bacterium]|nr:hypothetical protein [Campylobacterales bacterium]
MRKIILLTTSIATLAFGAPAFTGDIEFKQQDGTTFDGKLKGDEWFNWVEDKSDHIIKYNNQSKNFEYGMLEEVNGEIDLVPSGTKVHPTLSTLSAEKSKIDQSILLEIWKQKREKALSVMNTDQKCK